MRILLIVYDNGSYMHCFPQGLAYISAVLVKEGHEVEIYSQDKFHYPEEHLTEYLNKNRFDVAGVSVIGGYYQYRKLLMISEAINKAKHKPFYIIGGHGPSPEPEFFLKKTNADVVVIGEGENTAVELINAIERGKPITDIKGIAFLQDERVKINPRRPLIEDIDNIPFPAYDLFPVDYYRLLRMPHSGACDFVMPVLSSRGCPFTCTFCYRMDQGFRLRSNESIIDEIKLLKEKYRINYIAFSDELLMTSGDRTTSLCESILKSGLGVKWECDGRLNYAKPEILEIMKRAGCVFINYGIEAIDDNVLRNIKKALTYEQIVKGIEATLAAGISPGLNIIFGNIGDTKETLNKGIEFLLRYDDGAQMRTIRPVTPYPGSELYNYAIKKGLLKDAEDFYKNKHLNSDLLSINFTGMSNEDFHRCLLEANTRLVTNYFNKKLSILLKQAEKLYLKGDSSFRGFRQI